MQLNKARYRPTRLASIWTCCPSSLLFQLLSFWISASGCAFSAGRRSALQSVFNELHQADFRLGLCSNYGVGFTRKDLRNWRRLPKLEDVPPD